MKTYRGKRYEERQIVSAAEGMGYLVWPKITDDRCYGDEALESILDGRSEGADADYVLNVREMRDCILDSIRSLKARNISRIRLGASWAEGDSPGGRSWMRWYFRAFHEAGFDILPCINYTPIRLAEARLAKLRDEAKSDPARYAEVSKWRPATSVPPEPITALADYVDEWIDEFGPYLGKWVELWNEPNLITDWEMNIDATGRLFVEMIAPAAEKLREKGYMVLLGGLTKYDESTEWMRKTCPHGILDHVDAVGLHGNRGTWTDRSVLPPWKDRIREFKDLLSEYSGKNIPIWITEAGFTTVDLDLGMEQGELEEIQAAIFADLMLTVAEGDAERVYWYAERDLIHESVRYLTTGWEDILQFFFGDTDLEGNPKLVRRLLEYGGPIHVLNHVEENKLWHLVDAVIDRGDDPGAWTPKIKGILDEMRRRAAHRDSAGTRKAA